MHGNIFQRETLADELGVSKHEHGVVRHQSMLNGNYPVDAHPVAFSPTRFNDVLGHVTTHFFATNFLELFARDVIDHCELGFHTAGAAWHDFLGVCDARTRDAALDRFPLYHVTVVRYGDVGADHCAVHRVDERFIFVGLQVLHLIIAEDLPNIHRVSTKFVDVFLSLLGHQTGERNTVLRAVDIEVGRERTKRQGHCRGTIGLTLDNLHRLIGVDLRIQLVIGDLEHGQDSTIKSVFTNLRTSIVVDRVDRLLLHAGRRQALEQRLVQQPQVGLSRHGGITSVLARGGLTRPRGDFIFCETGRETLPGIVKQKELRLLPT